MRNYYYEEDIDNDPQLLDLLSLMDNVSLLKEVNKAIHMILVAGQSYQIGSRKMTRADLGELRKWRDMLIAEINADKNTSSLFDDTYVAVWDIDPR